PDFYPPGHGVRWCRERWSCGQIPARESTGRVAVDVHEALRRSPLVHERSYRLRSRMTSQDDLPATITISDKGNIGFTLQHSCFRQLRNVVITTQVCHIDTVGKTLIGSVVQQI